jgi:hypothetical protein
MKTTKLGLVAAALAAAFLAVPTFAQDQDPPGIAGRVAYLSGQVSLEAGGADDWSSAPLNYPMVSGDRMFTGDSALAEVQCGDTDIRLGGDTDVTLTNLTDQYKQIGLAAGSIHVRVFSLDTDETVEVDTPTGAVMIDAPGDYRINAYPAQPAAIVMVRSGWVQLAGPNLNQEVDQGEAVQVYGADNPEVGLLELPPPDGFDQWSMRRDQHIMNAVSARYVSAAMPGYDDLDDYGDWTPASDYGPIWFPRAMPVGWQPYTTGHWAYVAPWGYTWVDDAAWGYAPFHYGRWVMWQGRWGWVPGPPAVRPIWAPAFVAFVGGGPGVSLGVSFGGGGVAAWFPLGVAEPFVPWYRCSPAYVRTVNVTNVNITVIHNVTIVNNYNVFINRVQTVQTVNEIQVNNITYVNREHVVAVNASVMSGGGRVQAAIVRLNPQQQQALVRAPIAVAAPPVPPPAHVTVGVHVSVAVAAARPVLVTPHGRVAATPAANTVRVTAASLPKPAPATAIRPATKAAIPSVRPAAAPVTAGRPGQPAAPANSGRPVQPSVTQPRPTAPAAQQPARPIQPTRPEQPAAQPAERPAQPANTARPADANPPARTAPAPARPAQPAQTNRPENATPQANRPAPQVNPGQQPAQQGNKPAANQGKNPPPKDNQGKPEDKDKNKKPPKEEDKPQPQR